MWMQSKFTQNSPDLTSKSEGLFAALKRFFIIILIFHSLGGTMGSPGSSSAASSSSAGPCGYATTARSPSIRWVTASWVRDPNLGIDLGQETRVQVIRALMEFNAQRQALGYE